VINIITILTLIFAGISAVGVIIQLVMAIVDNIGRIQIQGVQASRSVQNVGRMNFYLKNIGNNTVLLTDVCFLCNGKKTHLKPIRVYNHFLNPTRFDAGGSLLLGYEFEPDLNITEIIITSTSSINGLKRQASFPITLDFNN